MIIIGDVCKPPVHLVFQKVEFSSETVYFLMSAELPLRLEAKRTFVAHEVRERDRKRVCSRFHFHSQLNCITWLVAAATRLCAGTVLLSINLVLSANESLEIKGRQEEERD